MSLLASTKDLVRPSNVNRHLEGLRGEFGLMAQEIESLRKERNEYRAKVKELQVVQRNVVCERCRKRATNTPQIIASSQLKTRKTSISTPSSSVPQSDFAEKPSRSGISLRVDTSQQRTTRHLTQHTTLIQKPQSAVIPARLSHPLSQHTILIKKSQAAVTPARPSRPVFHTITQDSDPIVAHLQTVPFPSPLPELSVSKVGPDSAKDHNRSIIFNNDAEKELDVQMIHVLSHGDTIESVTFSRDGKYLAAACRDGKAYIYNAESGTLTCILRNLLAENDITTAVCFSHNGKYFATASSDWNVYIWEIKTNYVRNAFKGHTRLINSLDFSPNGRLLVTASNDNTARLWDMRYGAARVLSYGNPTFYYSSAVFSPDGMYIVASNSDGMVRIWDTRMGQLIRKMMSHMDWVRDVAFMPDGKGLMSGSDDMSLKYWDISSLSIRFRARSQTMDHLQRHASGVEEQTQPERGFLGHTGCVYSLSISPDGRWVTSGSHDHSVRIWDTRNAAMHCILNHDGTVYTVDFSPAGTFLASGDGSGAVKIWRYLTPRFTNPIPRD